MHPRVSDSCEIRCFLTYTRDDTTIISDLETGEVFCDYFTQVFDNIRPIDDSILDRIPQRETLENLRVTPLSWR